MKEVDFEPAFTVQTEAPVVVVVVQGQDDVQDEVAVEVAVDEPTVAVECVEGESGPGVGNNWCNTCRCVGGTMSACTKKGCSAGIPPPPPTPLLPPPPPPPPQPNFSLVQARAMAAEDKPPHIPLEPVLLSLNRPVTSSARGNLAPPNTVTQSIPARDWIKDRFQWAKDMSGTPLKGTVGAFHAGHSTEVAPREGCRSF